MIVSQALKLSQSTTGSFSTNDSTPFKHQIWRDCICSQPHCTSAKATKTGGDGTSVKVVGVDGESEGASTATT